MSEEEHEYTFTTEEPIRGVAPKANKNLALLLLGTITLIGTCAMAAALLAPMLFDSVPEVESEVLAGLNNLALLGLGALSALLGNGNGNGHDKK